MKLIRVGVDLAKNVFHLHGVDRSEKMVWRRKLVRADWIKTDPIEALGLKARCEHRASGSDKLRDTLYGSIQR